MVHSSLRRQVLKGHKLVVKQEDGWVVLVTLVYLKQDGPSVGDGRPMAPRFINKRLGRKYV